MSTRSIIGRYTFSNPDAPLEWEGVYCHWDGYPKHMGEALRWIVSRDGWEKAGNALIEHTWSSIDPHRTRDQWIKDRSDQWVIREGYGIAYPLEKGEQTYVYTVPNFVDTEALKDSWCEFVYIIGPNNIIDVYSLGSGAMTQVDTIRANVPLEFFIKDDLDEETARFVEEFTKNENREPTEDEIAKFRENVYQ